MRVPSHWKHLIGGFDYIDYSTNTSTLSWILRLVTSPRDLVHQSLRLLPGSLQSMYATLVLAHNSQFRILPIP